MKKSVVTVFLTVVLAVGGVFMAAPAQAASATNGDCTIKANNPHPSVHVNGTINATGTIECKTKKANLHINVSLERRDGAVWKTVSPSDYLNTYKVQNNAFANCSAGPADFRTRAGWVIQHTSTSAKVNGAVYTAWMPVACGTASRVAPK